MSEENIEVLDWSPWLDLDKSNIVAIPESSGI
jgi:hypothetical protein